MKPFEKWVEENKEDLLEEWIYTNQERLYEDMRPIKFPKFCKQQYGMRRLIAVLETN